MIVCSCFGTTDREIRAAYGPGGDRDCVAGQGCGNCLRAVESIAAEAGTPADESTDAPPAGADRAASVEV